MLKDSKYPTYRMPAEWEKQKSTWVAWPHNQRDWPCLLYTSDAADE